ncbi:Hypothetical_protein [Hexamita inflata]|uniref:Hypothetical_protein n=1 Tax=Hexamita inflata TaxID=28002 RepID=A0ABP1K234_9EUKA
MGQVSNQIQYWNVIFIIPCSKLRNSTLVPRFIQAKTIQKIVIKKTSDVNNVSSNQLAIFDSTLELLLTSILSIIKEETDQRVMICSDSQIHSSLSTDDKVTVK